MNQRLGLLLGREGTGRAAPCRCWPRAAGQPGRRVVAEHPGRKWIWPSTISKVRLDVVAFEAARPTTCRRPCRRGEKKKTSRVRPAACWSGCGRCPCSPCVARPRLRGAAPGSDLAGSPRRTGRYGPGRWSRAIASDAHLLDRHARSGRTAHSPCPARGRRGAAPGSSARSDARARRSESSPPSARPAQRAAAARFAASVICATISDSFLRDRGVGWSNSAGAEATRTAKSRRTTTSGSPGRGGTELRRGSQRRKQLRPWE